MVVKVTFCAKQLCVKQVVWKMAFTLPTAYDNRHMRLSRVHDPCVHGFDLVCIERPYSFATHKLQPLPFEEFLCLATVGAAVSRRGGIT
jgi:hypothetical protein